MRSAMNTVSGERHHLLTKILQHTGKFSIMVFLGSLFYTAQMIGYFGPFAEHTRISEHALMPGLVTERFNKEGLLNEYMRSFSAKSSRQEQICTHLHSVGVPCYEQKWSVSVLNTNKTGQNVYGVVRARRATGVEAMLLAAEIEHKESVALMLAYAAFANEQVYWARDIFFLFVDGGAFGMDAFLSKYHLVPHQSIQSDPLKAMGGSLIAGIVVKSQKAVTRKKTINVQLNQLNGQQPNLDLFNSVVKIAGMERFLLETVIYDVYDIHKGGKDWPLLVPLRAVYTQAFTAVEGTHSVFGKYGVQGLSIALPMASSYSLGQSTRLVEAIARALNNVLERLHQSYFMYVLTSEDTFLSIAYYMPSMSVLAPLLFFAYREWVHMASIQLPLKWLLFHLYGFAIWILSRRFFAVQPITDVEKRCLLALLCLPLPLILPRSKEQHLPSLRFFVYLEFALAAMAVALLNFGLAFICSTMAVPLVLRLSLPVFNVTKTRIRTVAALLTHPLILFLAFIIYLEPFLMYKPRNIDFSFANVLQLLSGSVLKLLKEELLFGSTLFSLLCLIAIPLWNCLLEIASSTSEQIIVPEVLESTEEKLKAD